MKILRILLLFLYSSFIIHHLSFAQGNPARPWTYWWWMGSAVNEAEITRQLQQMAEAGLGGVHIIPIYGTKGYESQFIPFLSSRWLAVFAHTVREANRLGMGVDLTTGTGWPFGGPNVTPQMAAQQWKLDNGKLVSVPTRQQVKRAAPGGVGPVLDPFDRRSLTRYLARFDSTLARLPVKPRAVYNDSYEVYGGNWTHRFPEQFQKRRGYDLTSRLSDFLDTTNAPAAVAVRRDYHNTLADLLRDEFTATWTAWARKHGYRNRNQAHGSPGNLLDLYALADIPETESFGSSQFPIPGLRVDPDYEEDRFGTPHPLAMKFASSAAHLLGKPLVSSETTTWLANHFKVSLSQIKPQIDELFTAGINHVFYHGTTYSPGPPNPTRRTAPEGGTAGASKAPLRGDGGLWPGWLFYASTNYGPSSHNWPFLPLLNQYVTRCQTRLQASKPDNDLLVYFPIHDLWAKRSPSAGGVHLLEVHHVDRWLLPMPFGKLCDSLRLAGYNFDFVSDKQLDTLRVTRWGGIQTPGGLYRALVVPPANYLPERTRLRLAELKKQGVDVIYDATLAKLDRPKWVKTVTKEKTILNIPVQLRRETMAEQGLSFIRKRKGKLTEYFVANLGNKFSTGPLKLATSGAVTRYDPLTNESVAVAQRNDSIWLNLPPGASCFLTVGLGEGRPTGREKPFGNRAGKTIQTLTNPWQVQFLEGKPALKASATLPELRSWTTLSDSAGYFWGKVRYTTTFDASASLVNSQRYQLDLGDVREVAEVRLNGKALGTAWCIPFWLPIPAGLLKPQGNVLEIDVTNLSANYMRLRDGQQPEWKKFYDANIVDIRYKPFKASAWEPMPSGLLGPVLIMMSDK